MPANDLAVAVTDRYRRALIGIRDHAVAQTTAAWGVVSLTDIDATHAQWAGRAAATVAASQSAAVRLTGGYLAAYLTASTGRRAAPPATRADGYVGVSRAGTPLDRTLVGARVAVKEAITRNDPDPLGSGLAVASRLAGTETLAAGRSYLQDTIRTDPRVVGWRRVTGGGCGACMAAATGAIHADSEALPVHDNCRCTAEPVIRDAPDVVQRPTGSDIFNALSPGEQDDRLGPETARLVREGHVALHDLIAVDHMNAVRDGITQAPLRALT